MTIAQAMSPASQSFCRQRAHRQRRLRHDRERDARHRWRIARHRGASASHHRRLAGTTWTVAPKLLSDVHQRRDHGRRLDRRSFRASMSSIRASRRRSRSSATEPRRRASARAALMAAGLTRSSIRPGSRSARRVRPSAFTATGASDGAAVAPGPALTIKDPGPWRHLPRHQLRGQHGIALALGNATTPGRSAARHRRFQAQVSYTAGGPPISGLLGLRTGRRVSNATISGGNGPGRSSASRAADLISSPSGRRTGPPMRRCRASVKVGLVFDLWGEGQSAAIISADRRRVGQFDLYRPLGRELSGSGNFYSYDTGPALATNRLSRTDPDARRRSLLHHRQWRRAAARRRFESPAELAELDGLSGHAVGMGARRRRPQRVRLGQSGSVAVHRHRADGIDDDLVLGVEFLLQCRPGRDAELQSRVHDRHRPHGLDLRDDADGRDDHHRRASTRRGSFRARDHRLAALVACTANCSASNLYSGGSGSVWTISVKRRNDRQRSHARRSSLGARRRPTTILPLIRSLTTSYGYALVKAGTFSLSVNGAVVCTDSNTPSTMSWAAIARARASRRASSTTRPATTRSHSRPPPRTTLSSPRRGQRSSPLTDRTSSTSTIISTMSGDGTATGRIPVLGLSRGRREDRRVISTRRRRATSIRSITTAIRSAAVGLTQMLSWFYGVKLPSIFTGGSGMPYMSPSTPFITASVWRADGPIYFQGSAIKNLAQDSLGEDWSSRRRDPVAVLRHDRRATVLDPTFTLPARDGADVGGRDRRLPDVLADLRGDAGNLHHVARERDMGRERVDLQSRRLAAPIVGSVGRRWANALYYRARASRSMPDRASTMTSCSLRAASTERTVFRRIRAFGFTGGRRIASRWAALIYGGLTSASNASRADARPREGGRRRLRCGVDCRAVLRHWLDLCGDRIAPPWSGSTATITGGLQRPCAPVRCRAGALLLGLQLRASSSRLSTFPRRNRPRLALGEVGQTFHITASGTIGGSGSGTVTGGCSGTSGTGSNCIDIALFDQHGGTYGTAAALATCGENNLNGSAPWYTVPGRDLREQRNRLARPRLPHRDEAGHERHDRAEHAPHGWIAI